MPEPLILSLRGLQARKLYLSWQKREAKLVGFEEQMASVWKSAFKAEIANVLKVLRRHSQLMAADDRYRPIIVDIRAGQKTVEVKTVKNLKKAYEKVGKSLSADTAIRSGFKFPGFPKETQRFIQMHVPKVVADINTATRKRILTQITIGVKKGETLKQIASRIRNVYSKFTEQRAYRIARHETSMIGFKSEYDMFAAMPIDKNRLRKTWHNAQDDRVRDAHEIEGETVLFLQKFSNGLRFPHDPEGAIENTANCRCFLTYEVK